MNTEGQKMQFFVIIFIKHFFQLFFFWQVLNIKY